MVTRLLAGDVLELVNINGDTIIFTLINTLIIFLLYRFLLHNKVMAVMESRKEKINSEMKAAEDAQAKAQAMQDEYARLLEQSKEEAAKIVSDAVKRAMEILGNAVVTNAGAGNDIVKQIMVAGRGPEGMTGIALFPAELVQA